MLPEVRSLFTFPAAETKEVSSSLAEGKNFRLEHIASHGAQSPEGFWYDQDEAEWVALIRGHATLQFETGTVALSAGDALLIPAHMRHRVGATSSDAVWLALHHQPL